MKWGNLHIIFKSEHESVVTPTMAMAQVLQSSSIHLLRGFWRSFLVLVDLPPPHASREKRPASCTRPPAKWTTVLGVGCRWQPKSLSETKTTRRAAATGQPTSMKSQTGCQLRLHPATATRRPRKATVAWAKCCWCVGHHLFRRRESGSTTLLWRWGNLMRIWETPGI